MVENLADDIIENFSCNLRILQRNADENGDFKYTHSHDMKVQLATGNWIHPSLCTPKSLNHNISFNLACQKYIQYLHRDNPNLKVIEEN